MKKRAYFLQLLFQQILLSEPDRGRRVALLSLLQLYMNRSLSRARLRADLRNLVHPRDIKAALQKIAQVRDQLLEDNAMRHAYLDSRLTVSEVVD